jgi:hypothetical protein
LPQPKTREQCPQCWRGPPELRWPDDFIGARGVPVRHCKECRAKYGNWANKSQAEKDAIGRRGVPVLPELRARLFVTSLNRKLGGIPNSVTSRGSCPPSCSFYGAGCYSEYHVLAAHWRRVGLSGDPWAKFVDDVAALPTGALWRHNVAGDLPGAGETVDPQALRALVAANRGKRGFTFTHCYRTSESQKLIDEANRDGFVVNLSADSLLEADRLAELGIGPVAVVLPSDAPDRASRTPGGRKVVVCPAQTSAGLTCASCATIAHRIKKLGWPPEVAILFPGIQGEHADLFIQRSKMWLRAHGQAAAKVDGRVRLPVAVSSVA